MKTGLTIQQMAQELLRQSKAKQDYEDIIRLFAGLPETYRAVLEMKFLLDCSGKDISQKLGISENAVNVRISRGRAMLREIMEKEALHL